MNEIRKSPVAALGYHFIEPEFLPPGKDEYYLRNRQNQNGIRYRRLTAAEIEMLVRNRNTSDDWNQILVSDAFSPELVQDCKFFGLVRIGKLEPLYLEFHNLRRPVGLYESTIISSDFGDNVVIDHVNYLSHYIVGNLVMIVNTNELATTDHAKFGNGILKDGEPEAIRIWLEICNENGGRRIIPFDGMLPGDAWLWSRYREDAALQEKFREFTQRKFDGHRGYYGTVGDRTVIKNCKIIKDVMVGTDAYLKGANKLKNLTINSSAEETTQIGEGCELVNGIIGEGCRIFYGVKAVRFILASHSQLKYGARLINSYLGNNSTISCCEVLNSLIFPSHEQHHNNSFLCASLLQGQSNVAAGATIGSNHNSRSPDGELVAGRGFWPGLCVSLKHNSRFASFVLLAKGDYPAELDIPIPFSLVSNSRGGESLQVMPAYWFMHNLYALARNSWKYADRDKRTDKTQLLEYDFLAPDSIHEILHALDLFARYTGKAFAKHSGDKRKSLGEPANLERAGKRLLESQDPVLDQLQILGEDIEHSTRPVRILKIGQAFRIFKELVSYYAATQVLDLLREGGPKQLLNWQRSLPARLLLFPWVNAGGQLIPQSALDTLTRGIRNGKISHWDSVHETYRKLSGEYSEQKRRHALAALRLAHGLQARDMSPAQWRDLLLASIKTREWMTKKIYESRAKDYRNPFRRMIYGSSEEMEAVIGSLAENAFIRQEKLKLHQYKQEVQAFCRRLK